MDTFSFELMDRYQKTFWLIGVLAGLYLVVKRGSYFLRGRERRKALRASARQKEKKHENKSV